MPDPWFVDTPFTLAEQIAEVERELGMRRAVYPRRVAEGKMTQKLADRNIAAMEAVLATLNRRSA